jgi:tetratricopeptide (TPR) repeat protein
MQGRRRQQAARAAYSQARRERTGGRLAGRMPQLCGSLLAALAVAGSAHADGPAGYRPRASGTAAVSEQSAIDAYNNGYASILRAEHQENLAAATSGAERSTAQRESRVAYEAALKHFEAAVRFDGSMHEAYTYLGYANRKLGRYEQSLKAYDAALRINPDYPYAIEYQGVAFLSLNRVDEARFNYLRLYALDTEQAHKLFVAMQAWLEQNKAKPPKGVDIAAFEAWVAERAASTERSGPRSPAATW